MQRTLILLFSLVFGSLALSAAEPAAAGRGTFDFKRGADVLKVWYFRPAALAPDAPVLFVFHGVGRNADEYLDDWVEYAERKRFLLVVPEFSKAGFPGDAAYNSGNMFDPAGRPLPREQWSYTLVEPIFDALTARLGHSADSTYQQHFAQTSQRMVEFAQAQSVLRAFNGSGGATRLLDQAIDQQRQSGQRLIYRSSLSAVLNAWAVQGIFCALLVAVALWCDALDADEAIAACVALVLVCRYIEPLLEVASYGEILRSANAQLDAVHSILAEQPLPVAVQPKMPADSSVELRSISFRYAPDEAQVLRGVSLRIEPGSMTALIGASGSGKTTLVRLLARFFDASRGQVLIGGVDVREMSEAALAAQISQIFQDTYLFQGSIADNIRLGKPGASLAEIAAVAEQAGVAEIIARLPLGLHTPVGEGGARLSGGERQRIAIARALLKDAPILLVDEATAALDTYNQAAIAEALARLRGRCTLIVIAHQLSTVAMADQIVVLDDGEIVEQGTPKALAASGGRYAQFLAQRRAARGWRIA